MEPWDRDFAVRYLGNENTKLQDIHWDFIRLAMASVAKLAVIPLQDYLGLGGEARMNTPSTLGLNWKWRLLPDEFSKELAAKCRDMAWVFGRCR